MAKIFITPFADSGDKDVISDVGNINGTVSFPDGWTSDYSKPLGDPNYKAVGRKEMNAVFNLVTTAILELQTYGFALWQAIPGGWPQHARVFHNGVVYKNTTAGNTSTPPNGNWELDDTTGNYLPLAGGTLSGALTLNGNAVNPLHAVPLQQVEALIAQSVPIGGVFFHAGNSVPYGCLECDGRTLSNSGVYQDLFNVINYTYGQVGTNFKIPDLRGAAIMGWDHGRGLDNRNFGVYADSANKAHNHGGATGGNNRGHSHLISGSTGNQSAGHTHSGTTGNTGTPHAHTGTTGANNRGHSHGGTALSGGSHQHSYTASNGASTQAIVKDSTQFLRKSGYVEKVTDPAGAHTHTLSISGESQNHTHTFTTDSGGGATHNHSFTTSSMSGNHTHSMSFQSQGESQNHTHTISSDGATHARPCSIVMLPVIRYK